MKRLDRHIFGDLVLTLVIAIAFLNSILMMEKLLRLSRLLSGVGASAADLAKIIILIQPQILLLSIPMALLLSVLLVYGRMNHDNEIVVMRAAGMSFSRISRPVFLLGTFCFAATLAVSFLVGPLSSARLREAITRIIAVRSALSVEEGTFNTSFRDIVIIVKAKKDPETLEDIFIYDSRKKDEPRVLMAKEGTITVEEGMGIALQLVNGYVNMTKGNRTTELFFDRYRMSLSLDAESPAPKKVELNPAELLRAASAEGSEKRKSSFLLEFHRRISLPFVCLVLIFLGPPLSLMAGKSGRLGGLSLGLLVFTAYYTALIYGEGLVMAGKIPHFVGAWSATALLCGVALVLFRREARR